MCLCCLKILKRNKASGFFAGRGFLTLPEFEIPLQRSFPELISAFCQNPGILAGSHHLLNAWWSSTSLGVYPSQRLEMVGVGGVAEKAGYVSSLFFKGKLSESRGFVVRKGM